MKAFIASALLTAGVYFFGGEISTTLIGIEFTPIVVVARSKKEDK